MLCWYGYLLPWSGRVRLGNSVLPYDQGEEQWTEHGSGIFSASVKVLDKQFQWQQSDGISTRIEFF